MSDIKNTLKALVQDDMLPQLESYIDELHIPLEKNSATEDDMTVLKEMESFMVELQNILEAIDRDMISDVQAEEVYGNMIALISEGDEEELRA